MTGGAPALDSSRTDDSLPTSAVLDRSGEETLELFRQNDAYSGFLLERLLGIARRPLAGRVLEVGCGIGNLTRWILKAPEVERLVALDLDPAYVRRVHAEVLDPRLEVLAGAAETFAPERFRQPEGQFDFIISANVLEHIQDDAAALRSFRSLLRPDGQILLLVPAHPFLFSSLDRELSHFRRYRVKDFRRLGAASGLRLVRHHHFNPLGALGWLINGRILRRRLLPAGQLSFYTRYGLGLSRLLDRLNPFPIGVSVLVALEAAPPGSPRAPGPCGPPLPSGE